MKKSTHFGGDKNDPFFMVLNYLCKSLGVEQLEYFLNVFSRRKAGSIADGVTLFVVVVSPFDPTLALAPKQYLRSMSLIKAKLSRITYRCYGR